MVTIPMSVPEHWQQRVENLARLPEKEWSVSKNNIWYHSRRDAIREAERKKRDILSSETKHVLLVGDGLGHLAALLAKEPSIESILWLEADPEIDFYLRRLRPDLFTQEISKVMYYFSKQPIVDNLETLLQWFQGKKPETIQIIPHAASLRAMPTIYETLFLRVRKLLENRAINQATIVKFQRLWNRNILLNGLAISKSERWEALVKAWKGKAFMIVGAGPSLTESIRAIRDNRNRFILLCADTAAIPLQYHGLVPDLIFSADPQWVNLYFALNRELAKTRWALEPAVVPVIPHLLSEWGARLYFWKNPFESARLFQADSAFEIAHGGSASTNAFDFARKCEASAIILAGQDLAFSENLAHLKGAPLEERKHITRNRFQTAESHNFRQLSALEKLPIPSIEKEKPVFTNAKMKVFIEWFEHQAMAESGIALYNLTPKGCRLKGFQPLSEEQLREFPVFETKMEDMPMQEKNEGKNSALSNLENMIREVDSIRGMLKQALSLSPNDHDTMERLLNKIRALKKANTLIGYGAQKEILEITESASSRSGSNNQLLLKAMRRSAEETLRILKKVDALFRQSA